MPVDRQKVNYAKSVLRRRYAGPRLTSGLLVPGRCYLITYFAGSDDFSNVGLAALANTNWLQTSGYNSTTSGRRFYATGTTPTNWSHGSILQEIKIDDLKSEADKVFSEASDTVTLTQTASEGGSQSGQVTFDKSILGVAIEELLAELDPNYIVPLEMPRRVSGYTVLV